jgi:beta-mannosidase
MKRGIARVEIAGNVRRISGSLLIAIVALFVGIGFCGARVAAGAEPDKPGILTLSSGWSLQDIAKVPDAAAVVSKPGFAANGWYKATVPGTVLTSLVDDGIYPDPMYGENNRPDVIPDSLCRASYWYRTEFTVPAREAGEHTWLNLDGINYIAEIWVNGNDVGSVKGAFSRGTFDITNFVQPGQPAALAIQITPPPDPGVPHEHTQAAGTGRNGGILTQDGATFLCTLGWDWIPPIRDRDIGIWQKVWISQSGPVVIENPLVTTDLPLPKIDSADVSVAATVRNITDQPQTGTLIGTIGDVKFQSDVQLAPGESKLVNFSPSATPQLHFANPKLWWPNTYGPQNLYSLNLRFDVKAAGAIAPASSTSDLQDISFGIRKITYSVPESQNLTISVNGVPIICKGGAWGMDEAMKRIPRERLEAQVRLHALANYTMIRNWVGQSTSEDFYDMCDKYGILLWDEFFQPNPSDGPNVIDSAMYLANVREKVLRFRNHPSIAVWCARNEGNPPAEIDAALRKIMAELEPARAYQANSNDGRGVKSGGPYQWRAPAAFYTYPATEVFKTELGSVSIPTLQSVQAMMPEKDWNTFNDDWAEHDLLKGAQNGTGPRGYTGQIADRYGATTDLAGFVREAQLANYEAYRAMYEGRFAKLFAPVTGVLTWMSNPAQNSMVWQIYSHDLEPNASLFAAKKACEPIHIQVNQSDWHVMVINATAAALDGMRARIRVFDMDATQVLDETLAASAPASKATDLGAIEWPAALSKVHFIKVELRDKDDHLVSDNFYWRTIAVLPPLPAAPPAGANPASGNGAGGNPAGANPVGANPAGANRGATLPTTQPATTPPAGNPGRGRGPALPREDFTDLQNLPDANVTLAFTRHDSDGRCLIDATITNAGTSVALLTHLQLRKAASNQRVLPVYYSDNYISLLPGESRTINIDAAAADLGDEKPAIALDGWNVKEMIKQ